MGDEREAIAIMTFRRVAFIIATFVFMIALIGISITIGSSNITPLEAYESIIRYVFPGAFPELPQKTVDIVMIIRAPRVLMAVFGGAALALGGCITQSLLKNPLATPYTLGVSSGAGFGAALVILFGFGLTGTFIDAVASAFIFSLIPICVVILASRRTNMTPMTIILCGVAMSYVFGACNTIFQFFGEASAVKSVVFWMVGDLNDILLWNIPYVAIPFVLIFLIVMFLSKDFNVMRMGDDTATSLGVNVRTMRTLGLVLACLMTAIVVSFTGCIGFVCLLAPQISRIFVGNDMKYLVPASACLGACLLSVADIVAKTIYAPIMLPVGAVTALVGGPVLVLLLLRSSKNRGSVNHD